MVQKLKNWLYFPLAAYFRFFAKIRLARWSPRIILITGSSGKTTLLHLLESQIGDKAKYSHHANSSYGIPFNILGLERKETLLREWPLLFLLAPLKALFPSYKEKLYVVEADCDRPHEGKFLTNFLKPEVTLWLSLSKTHSINFDSLVKSGRFDSIEAAIAHEFGYFLENTSKLSIVDGDSNFIESQLNRTNSKVIKIKKQTHLKNYSVSLIGTKFKIDGRNYSFKNLLPEETYLALAMCAATVNYLNLKLDPTFSRFQLPPGRSSVFKGIKNTTIIDSTYNAEPAAMAAILTMFSKIPAQKKWIVISDMVEQGKQEGKEHKKLAEIIKKHKFDNIILMGPRMMKHAYPRLTSVSSREITVKKFLTPKKVLNYLKVNLKGGEVLLFKGARFLEGVIEHLLIDKRDVDKLPRREKVWQIRRKKWGL